MGTRSLTFFKTEEGANIVCMYRQMDGYPSGHGTELAEFLTGITLVNGISLAKKKKVANGMGCLAAQAVAHFKHGPGGIYLEVPRLTADHGQEYVYIVTAEGVKVMAPKRTIFHGTWKDFLQFCQDPKADSK